jgi:hypothetical protein
MFDQQVFVLDGFGYLWLEGPPYGQQFPPPRVQVDGNVDLFRAFQAFNSGQALVCGTDYNLWFEQGPFGTVPLPTSSSYPPGPSSRFQIDGNVGSFYAWDQENIFVCGNDGNLWLEFGFGTTIPAVPPPRYHIDGNVMGYQPVSLEEVFVLGEDGNLWQEFWPFGTVPLPACNGGTSGCRNHVDGNVKDFYAVDSQTVYVLRNDGTLWRESGPFGQQVPSNPIQVDANAVLIQGIDPDTVYVVGSDLNLWQENAPFGHVPLPPCSQSSGLPGGCRELIWSGSNSNLSAFGYFPLAGGVFVIDGKLNLWQVGPPPVQIDESVISFQPLSAEQVMRRQDKAMTRARPATRPVRARNIG